MYKTIEPFHTQIKENIFLLIKKERFTEASTLLDEYERLIADDIEIFSIRSVLCFAQNKVEQAEAFIREGLKYDSDNFDLLYNLAYSYELRQDYSLAASSYYALSHSSKYEKAQEELALVAFERLKEFYQLKPKITFFVKPGMDSFLEPVMESFSEAYITKKVIVNSLSLIDSEIENADICWFEWCDELIVYASKLDILNDKIVFCRLHSYEAFTDYPPQVNWEVVNGLIFVAEHIRDFVTKNYAIPHYKTFVIPNGIDISKYCFAERNNGFNIAYVGYINYKKGPMLLLHAFKALHDLDSRYKLFLAGEFQDHRDVLYFQQMVKEFNLMEHVIFTGWQNDLDSWLEDKDYILCTSILESQNLSVMQAMAKGIKPLIHNFVGSKTIYPEEYIWSSIGDLVKLIQKTPYTSFHYRAIIEDKYSLAVMQKELLSSVQCIYQSIEKEIDEPKVSIGLLNYNYEKYLKEAIQSVLDQTYTNIEIIIIDDCSTDHSRELISDYAKRDDRIQPIFNEVNRGYYYGIRNFISNWSTGEYFIVLSADDLFASNDTIEKFVDAHKKSGKRFDFIYGDLITIDKNSQPLNETHYEYVDSKQVVRDVFHRFGSGVLPILNAMHKTSFYRNNGYSWEAFEGVSNDTLNSLVLVQHSVQYTKIDYPMFRYRQHNENATFNLEARLKDIYGIVSYIIENFEEKDYMGTGFIQETKYEQKIQKSLFLAEYYFRFIKYYCYDYKVYGIWDVNIPKAAKLVYLIPFKKQCLKYVKEILSIPGATYKKQKSFVINIEKQLKEIYGK